LRGNRLEWRETPPIDLASERPVAVHVTILENSEQTAQPPHAGERMAAILEQLAHAQALADITDPAAWERMVREDRKLPERDT